MEKMTNVKALEVAIKVLSEDNQYDEVVEKLQKMSEQAKKKSSANRKPTATQVENEKLKTAIYNTLATGDKKTVSEMMKSIPELADLTNQRVTSLVTALYKDGKLDRVVEKRKAYFFRASEKVEEVEEE